MLWIANSYFDQKQCKNHLDRFVYCKTAVCGLLNYFWIIVITCLDSRSDGTHSLQRINCWVNLFRWKKTISSTSWMAWGWVHFQLFFCWKWLTGPQRDQAKALFCFIQSHPFNINHLLLSYIHHVLGTWSFSFAIDALLSNFVVFYQIVLFLRNKHHAVPGQLQER